MVLLYLQRPSSASKVRPVSTDVPDTKNVANEMVEPRGDKMKAYARVDDNPRDNGACGSSRDQQVWINSIPF